jgi:N-acyl-L-homoserine lactone synthetase
VSDAEIEVRPAVGDEERLACFALRAEAALESRWVDADTLPGGLERDAYDDAAVQIVACCDGRVVGTLRIVDAADDVAALLAEHAVALPVAGTLVVGRLVVARDLRRRSREITVGFYAAIVRHALAVGAQRAVTFAAENAIRFYRLAGFPLKIVGPPTVVTGVTRYPALFDEDVFRAFLARASEAERARMPDTGERS